MQKILRRIEFGKSVGADDAPLDLRTIRAAKVPAIEMLKSYLAASCGDRRPRGAVFLLRGAAGSAPARTAVDQARP
jgi:hypothetical protein